jgi:predicted Holliday junction resolvase-like endonuclease
MSPEQRRKIEEARRESIDKSKDVCADGEKHKSEYDEFANQINNE